MAQLLTTYHPVSAFALSYRPPIAWCRMGLCLMCCQICMLGSVPFWGPWPISISMQILRSCGANLALKCPGIPSAKVSQAGILLTSRCNKHQIHQIAQCWWLHLAPSTPLSSSSQPFQLLPSRWSHCPIALCHAAWLSPRPSPSITVWCFSIRFFLFACAGCEWWGVGGRCRLPSSCCLQTTSGHASASLQWRARCKCPTILDMMLAYVQIWPFVHLYKTR